MDKKRSASNRNRRNPKKGRKLRPKSHVRFGHGAWQYRRKSRRRPDVAAIGAREPSLSTILVLARELFVAPGEYAGSPLEFSSGADEAAQAFEHAPKEVQEAVLMMLRATVKLRRM